MSKRTSFHLFIIIGVLGLATLLAEAPLHAQPRTNARECRFQGMQRGSWTEREVKATIRCAAERWPVDLATVFYIADRESNFRSRAVSFTGCCLGVFQHHREYWDERVRAFLRATGPRFDIRHPSPFNARANVLVSVRMMHQGGYDPWGM